MKDITGKTSDMEEIFEDYATRPVPEKKCFGGLSQGLVWSGVVFCMTIFSVGGMVASSMSFPSFVIVVLLGSAIITVIGLLIGNIGARTHLSSAFNARFTLGVKGGKIYGLILAVSLSGWFGYQCHYFAKSVISTRNLFGASGGSLVVWTIIGGLLMMVTAIVGFSGITLLSDMGVPLLFALALIAAGITVGNIDVSVLREASAQAAGGMSISGGIVMVVGSFITGSCIIPDISRFSKKPRDAAYGCMLALMIAFPAVTLLGGFFYYIYGTYNLCSVLVTYCDMGMFVPFVLAISIWTTNDYNLYSSVLGISNALEDHIRLPRWQITLVVGTVSTLLGALGVLEVFTFFLNLLGVLIPPIAAVIIADYYLYNRNSGLYDYKSVDRLEDFRKNTCFAALVGILAGVLCNYGNIGFFHTLCEVVPVSILAMLVSTAALVIYNAVTRSGTIKSRER